MNRREVIISLSSVGLGAIGAYTISKGVGFDEANNRLLNLTSVNDSKRVEFGDRSPGFDSIEWFEDSMLRVYFGAHSMDGFGIRHHTLDDVKDDLWHCEPPKSVGTRDVPLINLLSEEGAVYPDRVFEIWAYEGVFSACDATIKFTAPEFAIGSVRFGIPYEIAPAENFANMKDRGKDVKHHPGGKTATAPPSLGAVLVTSR